MRCYSTNRGILLTQRNKTISGEIQKNVGTSEGFLVVRAALVGITLVGETLVGEVEIVGASVGKIV